MAGVSMPAQRSHSAYSGVGAAPGGPAGCRRSARPAGRPPRPAARPRPRRAGRPPARGRALRGAARAGRGPGSRAGRRRGRRTPAPPPRPPGGGRRRPAPRPTSGRASGPRRQAKHRPPRHGPPAPRCATSGRRRAGVRRCRTRRVCRGASRAMLAGPGHLGTLRSSPSTTGGQLRGLLVYRGRRDRTAGARVAIPAASTNSTSSARPSPTRSASRPIRGGPSRNPP
jgi:hypothetical protein